MSELAERWQALLPGADNDAVARRIGQGRAFYRSGRVTGLRLGPGRLSAAVQGSRATPYHVEVLVDVLDDAAWREVVDAVAGEVRLAAALLAGRWPDGLLHTLAARGVDLAGSPALDRRCPCGEADRPCAHLVALWEAAAERIAEDPFALLHLRGRGRQRLLADLSAARRAHGAGAAERIALDDLPATGWERSPAPFDDVDAVLPAAPEPAAAPLRLLGDPPGWSGAGSAHAALAPLVQAAAREAAALVRGTAGEAEDGEPSLRPSSPGAGSP